MQQRAFLVDDEVLVSRIHKETRLEEIRRAIAVGEVE